MKKIDLKDTTFLIPCKIESMDRIRNILLVLDFIREYFDTNISIIEADGINNNILKDSIHKDINYTFIEDPDVIFHRTHYINKLVNTCNSDYVAIWDTDVICNPQQILDSIILMRNNSIDFVYPYKDMFLDISKPILNLYAKSRDISILARYVNRMKEMYSPNPVGGAFIAKRLSYIKSGLENEEYYGWGIEDAERYYRWINKGYNVKRVIGILYHLTHNRGTNSGFQAEHARIQKELIRDNASIMNKEEFN